MTGPQAAIVLLNWNGWRDTVDCIASLLQSEYRDFTVVVCDNASSDDSWEQMCSWCEHNAAGAYAVWAPGLPWRGERIALIQTGANLGFAGGCNVGIRFALKQTTSTYVWLLNNDTVVCADALGAQIHRMQESPSIGLLGSTLIYQDEPDLVQCFGGYGFNFWTARVRPLPFPPNPNVLPHQELVANRLRYVSGASTFTSRAFIEKVGLLNEQYFLYFEEIDWAVRGRGFRLGYCPGSTVFHKEGRAIGSARSSAQRSEQSERWLTRNRILFTRTHRRARLPVTLLWVVLVSILRAGAGRFAIAKVMLQGLWLGMTAPVQSLPQLSVWPRATLDTAERLQPGALQARRTDVSTGPLQ